MKLRSLLPALAALLFSTFPAAAEMAAVTLHCERQLRPTTTFEFRFPNTMVAPEQVGQTAGKAPVVFHPAVRGHFVWLSQRCGTFTPDEPMALSTTYLLTLDPGLAKADGTALDAAFRETVKTPPFQLVGWNAIRAGWEQDASAEPKVSLIFNADVDAAEAGRFFTFVNKAGDEIAARVEKADPARHPEQYWISTWRNQDQSRLTWTNRFQEKRGPQPADSVRNHLWAVPAQPLPAGEGWRLVIAAGLPVSEGNLRLLDPAEVKIGTIRPFAVTTVDASNYINSGRRLEVRFSKGLAKEVTAANLARWVRVEPEPKEMKAEVTGSQIAFTGEFELDREYRVIVDAGLPAEQPFVLASRFGKGVQFNQVPPRVYFEEFSTQQMSGGARQFRMLTVNAPRVRVSARVFPADSLALALKAYEEYHSWRNQRRSADEPYGKVDLDTMPGQTVWQKEIESKGEVDEQHEVALDWNEILGAGKTGVVLLTAEQAGEPAKPNARPGAQAIVQVTDLGVVWKHSKGETFAHVFSLATGTAVAGARLRMLDAENTTLDEAQTDAAGVARLDTPKEGQWLLAEHGADLHLVAFRNHREYLSLRRLNIEQADDEDETDGDAREVMLFTERPVYKPGETVHLKGIARDWTEEEASIPAGAKVTVRAIDPRDRRIMSKTVTLSDEGSFSEDIVLPAGGLGTYRVEVLFADDGKDAQPVATHEIEVQEYTPNAFEIKIARAPVAVGETKIELPITAKYYMGKPLSKAQLTWSLSASDDGFAPAGFAAFDFCHAIHDYRLNEQLARVSHFSEEGKADIGAEGVATVATTIPLNTKAPQPRSARLLCEITDINQQTVSEASQFTIHSSDFYLGMRRLRGVVRSGEALPIDVIAVRTDGTPTPEPVTATLRLTRIDWQTNRVETAGNGSEYRNEPRYELVSQAVVKTRPLMKDGGKWQVAAGGESAPLIAGKPGQYLLEAVGKDAAGRDVITATAFSVYGEGETAWNYDNQFQIELVADQDEYRSGQTARILVKTPIAGEALVTVEREKVLRSFTVTLGGNAPTVEVPLDGGDAPNVYVSVMLLRGAADSPRKVKAPEYRVGYCELKVARPDAKLSVYVKPDAQAYRPGDEVSLGAQVLDAEGKPVANAEVTLYAVDEGVLSLMGYETPDPLAFFNQERALSVKTGLTLPTLLSEDPHERSFGNKGYLVGGGGEDSESLRKNFVACAFWNGSIKTDADGRIAAKFAAPDSLTRYRVIAVVQTARNQFGSAESAFEVNKPVMLEPALPRFANVGDKLILRGVLHNTTDSDGDVEVALELDETAVAENTTRRVMLPAHGSLAVDFPVEFKNVGQAKWKWTARFKAAGGGLAYRDAVQTTLNVGYPVPLLRELRTSQTDAAESDLLAGMNPELREGSGIVRVTVTNSRLLEMRESVEQLLHYPYGCVEQTTSSTLPWVTMRGFRAVLPSLKKTDAEIEAAVAHGIDRLLSMQTSSGGLSYWPGQSEPLFWGSAYGGFGLATARRAGFAVPEEDFAKLCKYLSDRLRGTGTEAIDGDFGRGGPSDRCLALYTLALAGKAEPAYHELLFKKRGQLSSENRALLALAIIEAKGPAEMAGALLDPAQDANEPENDSFWSSSRDSAMRLLAWTRHQPGAAAVDPLVTELFGRRMGGHWGTTQGNIWSLLALSEYLQGSGKSDGEIAGTLAWGEKRTAFDLSSETPLSATDFALNKDGAAKPLQLLNPGRKRVYTEVEVESRPRTMATPRQDQGYAITRTYSKVEDDGTLAELKDARVGDRVLVTLNLDVRRRANYVAVDDPLPSVFEAINPVFKSQETRAGETLGRDWVSDHKELREDRALFFADSIYPGQYTIRYLARVRAAGTATAPAAKIEEMYHPERFGMTETVQLTSLPLK